MFPSCMSVCPPPNTVVVNNVLGWHSLQSILKYLFVTCFAGPSKSSHFFRLVKSNKIISVNFTIVRIFWNQSPRCNVHAESREILYCCRKWMKKFHCELFFYWECRNPFLGQNAGQKFLYGSSVRILSMKFRITIPSFFFFCIRDICLPLSCQ